MKIIYESKPGEVTVVSPAPKENFKFLKLSGPQELQEYSDRFIGTGAQLTESLRKKGITNDFIASVYSKGGAFTVDDMSWLNYISSVDIPVGTPVEIVADMAIPKDRTFRNAWKKNGRVVETDMPKARIIHMNRIREARDEKLKGLDVEINQTQDNGGDTTLMRVRRQSLRDLPVNFSLASASTPKELSALFPAELTPLKGPATI